MPFATTNYGWTLPDAGAEPFSWEPFVRTAFQGIDTTMFSKFDKGGGTISGAVMIDTDGGGYSSTEPLFVGKAANAAINAVVRNNNSGAAASAGVVVNAYGNSWRMAIGSAAKNGNKLSWEVDALGSPVEKMGLTTDGHLLMGAASPINLWSGSSAGLTIKGTSSNAGKVTVSSSNSNNCTGELVASYGSDVVALVAKGDAAYPAVQIHQVNGSTFRQAGQWDASGHYLPGLDNTFNFGAGGAGIKQIYTNNSVIVSSDATLKTPLRAYTDAERSCARELRDSGGFYQWLSSVAEKGEDGARLHCGTTVQEVMRIMRKHDLDPFRLAIVCFDEWPAEVIEHPAVEASEAVQAQPAVYEERMVDFVIRVDGEDRLAQRPVLVEVQPAVPAQPVVQAREAYTETVRAAGSRYSLRYEQLIFFIVTAGA